MCGISGIISEGSPVALTLVDMLIALENRGRNSSGIITYNEEGRFDLPIRSVGSATRVFRHNEDHQQQLLSYESRIGIGHNRYATSGSKLKRDSQPLFNARPGMALSHNGQVANVVSLTQRLRNEGYMFHTECDAEVLFYALAQNLLNNNCFQAQSTPDFVHEKLFPSLVELMTPESKGFFVDGAYSVVSLIDRHGLLGFRDPYGTRPLSFGKRVVNGELQYAFASETTAFNLIQGFEEVVDVEPGQAIFVDLDMNVYKQNLVSKTHRLCSFEHPYFAAVDSDLFGKKVLNVRRELGYSLAEEFSHLKDCIDIITPVPDTPIPMAEALAYCWGKEVGGIVKRASSFKRTFQQATPEDRERVAHEKYIFNKEDIFGKSVGVVEDSIVKGFTMRRIINRLYGLGAKEVHVFSVFPAYRHACVYGIDTADTSKLIANGRSEDEVCQEIGATTLNYLPHEKMLEVIGIKDRACTACFTGDYHTGSDELLAYQERQIKERETRRRLKLAD